MHPYPHLYTVQAAAATGNFTLESAGLPALATAPPAEFKVHATLRVPVGTDAAQATRLLEKAEHVCLISNSLVGQRHLHPNVILG